MAHLTCEDHGKRSWVFETHVMHKNGTRCRSVRMKIGGRFIHVKDVLLGKPKARAASTN